MNTSWLRDAFVVLAALILAACTVTPREYRPGTEIPDGPGLFTGEAGAVILRLPGARAEGASAPAATVAVADREQFQEFDAFREFRRARQDRSPEYLEFLEWREWKRYVEEKKRGTSGR